MKLKINFIFLNMPRRFDKWQKNQDKNLHIFGTEGAFEVKWEAFFIIFKELLIAKKCLKPKNVLLIYSLFISSLFLLTYIHFLQNAQILASTFRNQPN